MKDGLVLCALLHILDKDSFTWSDILRATPLENATRALRDFERVYGVPKLMDPEDIVTTPDDKGMQLYLHYIIDVFNKKLGRDPSLAFAAATPKVNRLEQMRTQPDRRASAPNVLLRRGGVGSSSFNGSPSPAHTQFKGLSPVQEDVPKVPQTQHKRVPSVLSRYNPQPAAAQSSPAPSRIVQRPAPVKEVVRETTVVSEVSPPTSPVTSPLQQPMVMSMSREPRAESAPALPIIRIEEDKSNNVPLALPGMFEKERAAWEEERSSWAEERVRWEEERSRLEQRIKDLEARVAAVTSEAGPDVDALRGQVEDLEMRNEMLQLSLDDARSSQKQLEETARVMRTQSPEVPRNPRLAQLSPGIQTAKPQLSEEDMLRHQVREWERRALDAEEALEARTKELEELEERVASSTSSRDAPASPRRGKSGSSLARSPRSKRLPKAADILAAADDAPPSPTMLRGPVPPPPDGVSRTGSSGSLKKKSPRRNRE